MTETVTIRRALSAIQATLNAPKNQYNAFGKYAYRSCEDILAAVKPLLKEHECSLTLTDEVLLIGGRFYVRATAALFDEQGEQITVSALAREDETKKGMDGAQITGAASSYARKYALNGLFCIDDVKEPDATNRHEGKSPGKEPASDTAAAPSVPDDLHEAVDTAMQAASVEVLKYLWESHPHLHGYPDFKKAVSTRKSELTK